jgi:hypothetical protein
MINDRSGANVIKLFTTVSYAFHNKQEHLFTGKARAYPTPTNIRLGWKGLAGTKTLAYYENP